MKTPVLYERAILEENPKLPKRTSPLTMDLEQLKQWSQDMRMWTEQMGHNKTHDMRVYNNPKARREILYHLDRIDEVLEKIDGDGR